MSATSKKTINGYFPNPAQVQFGIDGRSVKLLTAFSYVRPNGKTITAPREFVADGAPIPRIFWRIIGSPFVGLYRDASIIHDYLYRVQTCSRAEADLIFLEGMKTSGVNIFKRHAMHRALRIGGWMAWNENTRKIFETLKVL